MLTNTLSFVARMGGIVLLVLLCWSQAQPLMAAAFAGELPVLGWAILVYLILIGIGLALGLLLSVFLIAFCLICSAGDRLKNYLNLILRDTASLPRGR